MEASTREIFRIAWEKEEERSSLERTLSTDLMLESSGRINLATWENWYIGMIATIVVTFWTGCLMEEGNWNYLSFFIKAIFKKEWCKGTDQSFTRTMSNTKVSSKTIKNMAKALINIMMVVCILEVGETIWGTQKEDLTSLRVLTTKASLIMMNTVELESIVRMELRLKVSSKNLNWMEMYWLEWKTTLISKEYSEMV